MYPRGGGEGALAGEVASIKLPSYKQMSRSLEHLQRTGRGHKTGPYDQVNGTIRSYLLSQNCRREAEGLPFLLSCTLGMGSPMQLVMSRRVNLEQHRQHGLVSSVTDSRWTCEPKTCHTVFLARDKKGRCKLTAASISSGENEGTLTVLMKSIEACRPCGPQCSHPLVMAYEDSVTTTFRRDCPHKIRATPTCKNERASCPRR